MLISMLKEQFVETVSLERYTHEDIYGERKFAPPISILCRMVEEVVIVKQTQTETITSRETLWCFEKIGDKDRINGQDVLEVKSHNSMVSKKVTHYRIRI